MSRTIINLVATSIIAITTTTTFAQDIKDPVERMTDRIMRQFMPSSFWQTQPVETPVQHEEFATEPIEQRRQSIHEDERLREFGLSSDNALPRSQRDDLDGQAFEPQPEFDLMPLPRGFKFPTFRMMNFAPQAFATSSTSASSGGISSSSAWEFDDTDFRDKPAFKTRPASPRPMSLSRASTNGVHTIQAVVPTENGPRRLELKGSSTEVRRQVERLPNDVRRMMKTELGL